MKYLRVTMPDGSQWDVPADVIAGNRAKLLASRQHVIDYTQAYKYFYEYTCGDNDELIYWASHNMNWKGVKKVAVRAPVSTSVDYQEGWVNGPKQIVEL